MTPTQAIGHVLRRLWFWPLIFWMRPLEVVDRIRKRPGIESITAVLGAGVWGALAGVILWLQTGDPQAIWILSLAVAGAFAFAGAFADAFADAFAVTATSAFAVAITTSIAGTNTFVLVFAGPIAIAGAVGFVVAAAGARAGVGAIASVVAVAVAGAGAGAVVVAVVVAVVFAVAVAVVFAVAVAGIFAVAVAAVSAGANASSVVGASAAAGAGADASVLGVAFGIALGIGTIVGFFFDDNDGIAARRSKGDLRIGAQAQIAWRWLNWGLFLPLAFVVYVLGPQAAALDAKLDRLALFLALAPLFLTGLPAWPLMAAIARRQYGSLAGQDPAPEQLARTIAFRWQSFTYPLPGLDSYLIRLGRNAGPVAALSAIQSVQLTTLQCAAARRATHELASDPATALPFCGTAAMETNSVTLATLAQVGDAGLAVAVLAPKRDQEDEEPLLLDLDGQPSQVEDSEAGLARIRERLLSERVDYAKERLEKLGEVALVSEYRLLLDAFRDLASPSDLRQFDRLSPRSGPAPNKDIWLDGGWSVVQAVRTVLGDLDGYGDLTTETARRRLLETGMDRLRRLDWEDTSNYWRGIAEELVAHWIEVLVAEAHQAREWLRLEVDPPVEQFVPGSQTLGLLVRNPTGELARKCELRMAPTVGLAWVHPQARFGLLEGGKETQVRLDFRAEREGALRIQGRLEARDLEGNPFSLEFAFQIQVAGAGQIYKVPDYQPYVVGEGLPSDRTFVGREDLLDWLRGLWLQPEGKPAVVLVGQRRIGKTSLLNKIERAGLPGTDLLGLTVNIQGLGSEYDFLDETARRISERLELPVSPLDRSEPYAAFKTFLQGVRERLGANRRTGRFLLMLDEADLIPERRLGERLPGFLRALMQEPQYPTLLLFCGTTRLRAMARDYFSILFNTAQFRTLSYLTREESSEVLRKPARGILEYDPAVLADAYRLTRGQPLLLQMLGAELVNRFNEQARRGEARSDYVDTNDFAAALEQVVRAGTNAAFENHWEDSDAAVHRVLAALAWATDEAARSQSDIGGLEAAMRETRLTLPRERTFSILERLADDEVLERDGPTYRFWVPLYRRWVAWRWPPERVREESIDAG